ncbi:DUF4125 family protein [Salidesulfovibrio onnuriiensis]|uniref:DUF4125 family protein n=1 Tax=Salidesulfovibrio onnuriiensis TaxID=2583823 RepID=UPI00164FFB58|nr:DUF4125 family protein [Salidesulfovibrio onnuriiensis]
MTNQDIIDRIIEMELTMFKSVISTVHSPCQDRLQTFRIMRWMSHSVLPDQVLESYLQDLQEAVDQGRNFMVEKYARMEGRIPPLKDSLLVEEIVDTKIAWMRAVAQKYPTIFEPRGNEFRTYISCELETLSHRTLGLLHECVVQARVSHRNMVEERYNNLFRRLGYESLEHQCTEAHCGPTDHSSTRIPSSSS